MRLQRKLSLSHVAVIRRMLEKHKENGLLGGECVSMLAPPLTYELLSKEPEVEVFQDMVERFWSTPRYPTLCEEKEMKIICTVALFPEETRLRAAKEELMWYYQRPINIHVLERLVDDHLVIWPHRMKRPLQEMFDAFFDRDNGPLGCFDKDKFLGSVLALRQFVDGDTSFLVHHGYVKEDEIIPPRYVRGQRPCRDYDVHEKYDPTRVRREAFYCPEWWRSVNWP